jgi:hypothetical protein
VAILVLLLAILCAGAVGFTAVGLALVRPFARRDLSHGQNETSGAIFVVAGTVYAVFLAFVVVAAWEAHTNAQAAASDEASLLATLYRGSTAMERQSGDQLRTLIRQYTRDVIAEEWKLLARGGYSERARRAGLEMYRVFGAMPPQTRRDDAVIDQAQLATLAQVEADRHKRILMAEDSLSPLIWWTAIINGLLVMAMCFFLCADRHWLHLVMSAILAVMIVMFLYVLAIYAKPFGGLMPLKPTAFARALDVYDSVDRTL